MRARLSFLLIASVLCGCSDNDIPSDSPYKSQSAETFGMQLKGSRVIDHDKGLHWFQNYVSGYEPPDEGKLPGKIVALKPAKNCGLPKPAEGARLVEVITWNSKAYAPIFAIDGATFDKITKNMMAVTDIGSNPASALEKREGQLQQVDVAVMPTGGSTHLVLSSTGPVLWNLVVAEGAHVSGVTLLSKHETVAIANVASDTPVAALVGEVAEKCGAIPALMPVKEYPGIRMQLHKANDNEAKFNDRLAKYRSFNRYFKRQFGVDSDEVAIGANVMNHAVVGAVPANLDARIAYKTIENAELRVTPVAFIFAGSMTDYVAAKTSAAAARASEMSGKDYGSQLKQAGY
jgi:hypothetical protein